MIKSVWSELCSENQTTVNGASTRTVMEWERGLSLYCPLLPWLSSQSTSRKKCWEGIANREMVMRKESER